MVSGGESLDQTSAERAVQAAGYEVASANGAAQEKPATSAFQTFKPLIVALGLIAIGSLVSGGLEGAMGRFMGGFFLVFSGLKMLDLSLIHI